MRRARKSTSRRPWQLAARRSAPIAAIGPAVLGLQHNAQMWRANAVSRRRAQARPTPIAAISHMAPTVSRWVRSTKSIPPSGSGIEYGSLGDYGVVRTHADTRPVADDPALPVSAVMPEARNDHAMRPDSLERSTYGNTHNSSKTTGVKGIPASVRRALRLLGCCELDGESACSLACCWIAVEDFDLPQRMA